MTDKEESLSIRLGRKLNGDEAVRLQTESNDEFYKGNVGTSLKLHLQSAASGAEHLGNLIGTEVKGALASAKTFIEANPRRSHWGGSRTRRRSRGVWHPESDYRR